MGAECQPQASPAAGGMGRASPSRDSLLPAADVRAPRANQMNRAVQEGLIVPMYPFRCQDCGHEQDSS